MIGQLVFGTLWNVSFRHNVLNVEGKTGPQPATGRRVIITADPSGADLYDVTRLVVLGNAARPEHQFTVTAAEQAAECQGLAQLHATDRAWSSFGEAVPLEHAPSKHVEAELAALWELAELVEGDDTLRLKAWEQLGEAKAARELREAACGARTEHQGATDAS